ncbi:MAG: proton extrusion protein PcxA [Moorea sp. SIO2B7]|nr:proton extrusion protein PcxA [Moorena sp. SIO2B7]
MKLKTILRAARRWLSNTPDRALDEAYRAVLMIKAIEDEHFNGQKVSAESSEYSDSVISYFSSEVAKHLKRAKVRLNEFKSSRYFLAISEFNSNDIEEQDQFSQAEIRDKPSIIIDKLNFIDEVISQYQNRDLAKKSVALIPISKNKSKLEATETIKYDISSDFVNNEVKKSNNKTLFQSEETNGKVEKIETFSDKTGVLPRSILRTFSRIRQEIDPKSNEAEEEVVQKFRKSRNKTAISIKFLLMLIIIPLLTHQVTKTFLVTPIINRYFFTETSQVLFINQDIEEEALMELKRYEENLHVKSLIGLIPEMPPEDMEAKVKHKAEEIVTEFRHRSHNALANVFADIFSLIAFAGVILVSKREIVFLKSFLDEIIYGLSDSAKAFLIILFTDMFVGYHSPHGWEIILEGISKHLGIPESREFNFLFIATFPVILDTVLKYWIFRYLNRISPSAVATYRNMNE